MTTGRVILLQPGDGWRPISVEEPLKLATVYDLIGCEYVQSIDTPIEGVEMLMDEEGKLAETVELNQDAQKLVGHWLGHGDFVAGNVILCANRGGEWVGLNEAQIAAVRRELELTA